MVWTISAPVAEEYTTSHRNEPGISAPVDGSEGVINVEIEVERC